MQSLNIDEAFAYLINRSSRLLRYSLQKRLKDIGYILSPEQWLILNRLYDKDGLSQNQLTDSLFKDKSNITRIIDSMEKNNWVRREKNAEDKRSYLIYLTDKAKQEKGALWDFALKERELVYKGLTKEDFNELKRITAIMEKNIMKLI